MTYIPSSQIISTGNSSTTPLAGGATFTGVGEFNTYPDAVAQVFTDAACTLFFDFSIDGTNWDSTFPPQGFNVSAGISEFHTAVKGARFFRVRLVNGVAAQTVLRMQVSYGAYRQGNLPVRTTIADDADAIVVRSIDPSIDLAFGRVQGNWEGDKFGIVYDVDTTSSEVDVWAMASGPTFAAGITRTNLKNWPTSSATLFMSSDNASDTNLDLSITYIDANGNSAVLLYTYTAGTTGASLGVAGFDINRAEVVGSNLNVGNLYFAQTNTWTVGAPTTPSDVVAAIPAGYGQTQQCAYRVPTVLKFRIKRLDIRMARASGAAGSANVRLYVRKPGGPWVVKRDYPITDASPSPPEAAGLVFNGDTQIRISVNDVSDNDTIVFAQLDYDEVT